MKFELQRSLTCEVDYNGPFILERFMSLFIDGGPLATYGAHVFGITPLKKINNYNITFKQDSENDPKHIINTLINEYQNFQKITLPCHTQIGIKLYRPKEPPKTITLWPVPHEIAENNIIELIEEQKWGIFCKYEFGKHKNFPQFKNAFLHIQIDNYQPENVPDNIEINEETVLVLKPGESIQHCRRCKTKQHSHDECPVQAKNQRSRPQPQQRQSPNSYSNAVRYLNNQQTPLISKSQQQHGRSTKTTGNTTR